MRNRPIRAAALALAALLALSPAASASQALGTEIHYSTTYLAEGVEYTRQYLWSATYSDLRTERYLEYSPNELVQPAVAYGDSILSKSTLSALAAKLESDGQRVLGGINGDYFVMATGAPLGMVITNGVLRSSPSYHYALGFDADGNAFIGKPDLSITVTINGSTYDIAGGLNKVRTSTGGFFLYTGDYGSNTNHTSPGVDVILSVSQKNLGKTVKVDLDVEQLDEGEDARAVSAPDEDDGEPITDSSDLDLEYLTPDEDEDNEPDVIRDTLVYTGVPTIGGRMSCTVEQVLHSTGSIDIPEGCMVLSVNGESSAFLVQLLSDLQEGDSVEIDITTEDERWESAVTAIGALYKMVTDGEVEPGLETTQAPRSAVGVRADGSTVFYTVDGRQSGYSVGASMEQVAQRLVELGCVEAVCMDGGGSTTFGATLPGEDQFDILNQPSDGAQRSVTNALFLVAEQTQAGDAQSLILDPGDAILLSGAQLSLSAYSVDALGQAVDRYAADELELDITRQAGTVDQAVLTAGARAGTYPLTAQADGLEGTAMITVVTTPDQITLRNESTGARVTSLHMQPGETVDLTASAVYRNLSLICRDEDFAWSISDGLGTIDQSGVLTASLQSGTGSVTITAGARTVVIPLTISSHIRAVEDFEGEFGFSGATARLEPETQSAYVHFGRQSARLTYSMGGQPRAEAELDLALQESEIYLSLWVYGDGSGNTLTAAVETADGALEHILCVLNFQGWQRISTTLPAASQRLTALYVTPTGAASQGVIRLDQITASNQYAVDDTAPTVTLSLSGNTLTAAISDNMDGEFSSGQVTVTFDGAELAFTLNASGTALSAALPVQDALAHRITVTAADSSGNIGRASADIAAGERISPFADMSGHWAESYVNYLYDQGISNGFSADGVSRYDPDQYITRGEFALMVTRWLRLDTEAFSGTELPFADLDSIPAWCLEGVRAMYALGIMQGSAEAGGIYANAGSNITRAEAMTMLGRLLEKGYGTADLSFADAADIPSWAAEHAGVMVALGVVNGYSDNTLAPNANIKRCEIAKILYTLR